MANLQPWDQQPKETDVAYQAFSDFLDLGFEREVPQLWEQYLTRDKPPTKKLNTLNTWRAKYKWIKRAEAFDTGAAATQSHAVLRKAKDLVAPAGSELLLHRAVAYIAEKEEIGRSRIQRGKAYENLVNRYLAEGYLPGHLPKIENYRDLLALETLADKVIARGDIMVLEAMGLSELLAGKEPAA